MKKVKRGQGKRKGVPVTPNQTKLLEPKKTRKRKEKRGRQGKYWSKKREDKWGMRGDQTKKCCSQKKKLQCVQKLNLI